MSDGLGFSFVGAALAVLWASACGPLGSEGEGPGAPSAAGSAGDGGGGASAGAGGGDPGGSAGGEAPSGGVARWNGIVGTGQSLAVGTTPLNPAVNQTDYGNLKLTVPVTLQPPFDPLDASLAVARLEEPLRGQGSGFPRAYPGNLWGETPHGAMANQISVLVQESMLEPHVTVHSVVGESGQGMVALRKGAVEMMVDGGIVGRAYAASMFEATAIARLAAAQEKTYGVSAIVMTHGETDAGNSNYEGELLQLLSDYNQDLAQITGQTTPAIMIVSQHHAYGFTAGATSGASASTLAQWRAGVNNPDRVVCSGPKYQYPYDDDAIHLQVRGYEMLGEKYGQIYFEKVVLGNDWRPLEPTSVERSGRAITVNVHVPVPPLAWDEAIPAPHQTALTEWAEGHGFEVRSGNTPIAIESVTLGESSVQITCAADIPAGAIVGYAVTSDGTTQPGLGHRWGQLRDSDPFVGATTGVAQANYLVSFELPVPAGP